MNVTGVATSVDVGGGSAEIRPWDRNDAPEDAGSRDKANLGGMAVL
jgi:hypothetical protein